MFKYIFFHKNKQRGIKLSNQKKLCKFKDSISDACDLGNVYLTTFILVKQWFVTRSGQ